MGFHSVSNVIYPGPLIFDQDSRAPILASKIYNHEQISRSDTHSEFLECDDFWKLKIFAYIKSH